MKMPGFGAERSLLRNQRTHRTTSGALAGEVPACSSVLPAMEAVCSSRGGLVFYCYWSSAGKLLGCDRGWHAPIVDY